jgi:hypothetical protein
MISNKQVQRFRHLLRSRPGNSIGAYDAALEPDETAGPEDTPESQLLQHFIALDDASLTQMLNIRESVRKALPAGASDDDLGETIKAQMPAITTGLAKLLGMASDSRPGRTGDAEAEFAKMFPNAARPAHAPGARSGMPSTALHQGLGSAKRDTRSGISTLAAPVPLAFDSTVRRGKAISTVDAEAEFRAIAPNAAALGHL